MFSKDKVTEIFCLTDEFCKFFDAQQEKSMLEVTQDRKRHRRKPNRMSDAEIIVILIHFHSGGFRCFKHYYYLQALRASLPKNRIIQPLCRTGKGSSVAVDGIHQAGAAW